jgi:hypothetical protein
MRWDWPEMSLAADGAKSQWLYRRLFCHFGLLLDAFGFTR